ncbi:MAG: DUF4271 domain-containing protein [Bacteroidota bacterium]|nr:DUF4271 domain-containing protein [Bacteroidota bacterium]
MQISFLSPLLLQASGSEIHGIPFPKTFNPSPLATPEGNWWGAALLFFSFTLIVILRVFDYRKLALLFNGFFRASSVSVMYREEYSLTSRISLLLLVNYLLVFPLFIWQVMGHFGAVREGLSGFAMISGLIFCAYFVKIISTRMLGNIFEVKEASSEYVYNILLFNKTTGLILFPVCLLLAYARQIPPEILIWSGIVSWCLILVYRLLRVVLIGLSNSSVSFFYIILYLCTLEIIPFVVILKVFVGTFQSFNP